jgi:hypothetical protein
MSATVGILLLAVCGFFIAVLMCCLAIGQAEDEQREIILAYLDKHGTKTRYQSMRL